MEVIDLTMDSSDGAFDNSESELDSKAIAMANRKRHPAGFCDAVCRSLHEERPQDNSDIAIDRSENELYSSGVTHVAKRKRRLLKFDDPGIHERRSVDIVSIDSSEDELDCKGVDNSAKEKTNRVAYMSSKLHEVRAKETYSSHIEEERSEAAGKGVVRMANKKTYPVKSDTGELHDYSRVVMDDSSDSGGEGHMVKRILNPVKSVSSNLRLQETYGSHVTIDSSDSEGGAYMTKGSINLVKSVSTKGSPQEKISHSHAAVDSSERDSTVEGASMAKRAVAKIEKPIKAPNISLIKCGAVKLPSFSFTSPLKPDEAFNLLLNLELNSPNVCRSKPVGISEPATFVIANECLGKISDVKADDLGVWQHKGKPIRQFKVSRLSSGEVYGTEQCTEPGDDVYQLVRVYYHHKQTPTFRRTLFYLTGTSRSPLTIIQYTFSDGLVVPIKLAPHGNSATSNRPFFCTQPSTLDEMKNTSHMKPKDIISKTYDKAGGMMNMSSCSEVGRNLKQIYNMKKYQGTTSGLATNHDKDLIYDLLEQHYHGASQFVRSANFDDGIVSIVGTDEQFYDVSRFCGRSAEEKSVLGVDPTFNLGDFYVTPTVYEHKLIINKKTGKHPMFMGPTLIHVDRKYGSYYYFASQLQKLCPDFEAGLNAVGTDGEEALSSAFSTVFPHCVHLLCSLHKRENIMRKLREFKVEEAAAKELLNDIFGSDIDGSHIEGLIDARDCSEFMEKLEMLKPKWTVICEEFPQWFALHEVKLFCSEFMEKLEMLKPKWTVICEEFPQWFALHEVELFCSSMITSVRCLAGLGNPPKYYTTNSNESLNNFLKRKVDFKRSEWPKFHEILYAAVSEQQEEFAKAVFSQGEYEFWNEYKHLQVTHLDWIQMSKENLKSGRLRRQNLAVQSRV